MDPISAQSESKILTARHISEKQLSEENGAINTTLLCHSYSSHPDFTSYWSALQPYAWLLFSTSLVTLLAICFLFLITLKTAVRHWIRCTVSLTVVLAVYPLVAVSAFITILVPRSRVFSEALSQQVVMVAMYHLFCMIIAECGGSEQLIRRSSGSRLETRVLPCCCWPCCLIPRPQITKENLRRLRYLVLQMPVIQAIIYVMVIVVWAEDVVLYHNKFIYFQPFIVASILTGVWGTIMCIRAAESIGVTPRARFLALQLVLLIVKLQCGGAKILPEIVKLPCIVKLNPSVVTNMLQNCLMMGEMLLLSIWAWRLYTASPSEIGDNKTQQVVVAVLDDSLSALDVKANKDGIDNRSFANKDSK